MQHVTIQPAGAERLAQLVALGLQLWPSHGEQELTAQFARLMEGSAQFFLALEAAQPVGFAQCQLRRDYVEGTTSSPVGYLEGIFVVERCRGRGLARALLAACENWAREQGCCEFASDCELDNETSRRFHLAAGFHEANRILCFAKRLVP